MWRRFGALLPLEAGEAPPALWSFVYFFCVLGGYYIVRPVRDSMGITGGVDNLQWLFTATFVAMAVFVPVYGWLAARAPRRTLIPVAYGFFIAHLVVFHLLLRFEVAELAVARTFYVWVSVFNLFVVSVFWTVLIASEVLSGLSELLRRCGKARGGKRSSST